MRAIGIVERNQNGKIVAVQGAFQDISKLRAEQDRADKADREKIDILEGINDAFFAVNENWCFNYVNQQAAVLLGRPRDELLGRCIWDEFPEVVGSEFQRQYQLARERQQTSQFQSYYAPLDKWLDVSAYPTAGGLAVYFRDITGERKSQERLRLIDTALSRQNDVVMITEANSLDEPHGPRIIYVNDAFERLTGYSNSEVLGRTPRMLQDPESDRRQLNKVREALHNTEQIRCDVLNYTKSGKPFWIELDITPLLDDEGCCTHFVAVERDITQRKEQESKLRAAQERFELISSATSDVIWDWDFTTNKIWWNSSMQDVFGHMPSNLAAGPESWTDHIHPDDFDRITKSIHSVIDGHEEFWVEEYRFLRDNGEYAYVVDRGFVMRDTSGKATRMVGSMPDVTERVQMERQLRESQKLEAIGHLTGGIAHDFNNLLMGILGNAEMLVESPSSPQLRSMVEMTQSAAKRGAELTSRLLAFARRQPLDPKPTNLNHQVQGMHALIRQTLPENIDLEFSPGSELGIVEIDAGEFDTALLNLVVNARDAMHESGKLTIETCNAVLDTYCAQSGSSSSMRLE